MEYKPCTQGGPVTNILALVAELIGVVPGRLRKRRKDLGLSQAALAERADVSVELVSRIERGLCLPSLTTLVRFCDALSTTPNVMLGYDEAAVERDSDRLVAKLRALPRARRREVERIAEALAHYEKRK
jgi:HTH-type transcriptional regulator, cell division transcriptional repressor